VFSRGYHLPIFELDESSPRPYVLFFNIFFNIISPYIHRIDQKQLENVKSFKYLGSILTNDGRCTCEIKCRIAMSKAAFSKKMALFTSTLDLELRMKLVKCYVWR
jgi:hypothetical protein